jgi:hypothetical protein
MQLATNERAAKHEADVYMQNWNWSSLVLPRGTQPHLALHSHSIGILSPDRVHYQRASQSSTYPYKVVNMPGLGGSNQDPNVRASAAHADAPLEVPPGSPTHSLSHSRVTFSTENDCFRIEHLEPLNRPIDRMGDVLEYLTSGHLTGFSQLSGSKSPGSPTYSDSLSSVTSSTDSARADSYDSENVCFYIEHLEFRHLSIDRMQDFFLLAHLTSGHLTGCSLPSGSNPDEFVRTALIREEVTFDQVSVHHLQLVNLRDEPLSPRHIRLLKLHSPTPLDLSGDTDDVRECSLLRCQAYQACLDDLTTNGQPLFAAASYVCGDQTLTQRILCGQNVTNIPQNAYDVLVHLRFKNRPRLIWIDCLCIKQDDAREKSHQVGMLHAIYSQAHVVSWLKLSGDVDLRDESLFLSLFARLWIDEVRGNESCQSAYKLGKNVILRLESDLESQFKAPQHRYALQKLASIFTADYFKRVWIAQEITLGKTNVCQIGDDLFSLATLTAASNVVHVFDPENVEPTTIEIYSEKIDHVCRSYLKSALQTSWLEPDHEQLHDVGIVTTLNQGNRLDPKDYIYGVASLFEESGAYDVDYTLSEAEVFAGFTVHCLKNGSQAFEMLNQDRWTMKSIYAHRDLRSDLPSWCPDWSVARRESCESFHGYGSDWQAGGTMRFGFSRPSTVTLALKGLVVSKLKLCCDSILRASDVWVRGEPLIWFDHGENLREFFKLQSLASDQVVRNVVVRTFERIYREVLSSLSPIYIMNNSMRVTW